METDKEIIGGGRRDKKHGAPLKKTPCKKRWKTRLMPIDAETVPDRKGDSAEGQDGGSYIDIDILHE